MSRRECLLPARPLTCGPQHHWFGYYDKCPWDATGRYLLCLEVGFIDRPPRATDEVEIQMIDLRDNLRRASLGRTSAWNWQMGARVQWLAPAPDRLIVYNTRDRDHYAAVIQDVFSGEQRVLPRPVYGVSHDARFALTLDFERLADTRPGYGYNGIPDPGRNDPHPDREGIYYLDLESGRSELVISLEQIVGIEPESSFAGAKHWFNHLLVSPDNRRFVFLHRWTRDAISWRTRFFTARPDGTDIVLVNRDEMTSHFDYKSPREILAWAKQFDLGCHYYVFNDLTRERQMVGGELFDRDGHCSYSPDGRWILTDTYPSPQNPYRDLILYSLAANERIDIGRYYSPSPELVELRCDLHPRWSRDGTQVCFDSLHEGTRQMYVVDVGEIVG